jgi:hypothetical protein
MEKSSGISITINNLNLYINNEASASTLLADLIQTLNVRKEKSPTKIQPLINNNQNLETTIYYDAVDASFMNRKSIITIRNDENDNIIDETLVETDENGNQTTYTIVAAEKQSIQQAIDKVIEKSLHVSSDLPPIAPKSSRMNKPAKLSSKQDEPVSQIDEQELSNSSSHKLLKKKTTSWRDLKVAVSAKEHRSRSADVTLVPEAEVGSKKKVKKVKKTVVASAGGNDQSNEKAKVKKSKSKKDNKKHGHETPTINRKLFLIKITIFRHKFDF